ncbi:hypothetical protein BYT27DRAFT_7258591 [Phlegmacium glaucopus]|nr:hypothetical protein BYT27DRAFT_7258591 [Phlegmacium glaucopus]
MARRQKKGAIHINEYIALEDIRPIHVDTHMDYSRNNSRPTIHLPVPEGVDFHPELAPSHSTALQPNAALNNAELPYKVYDGDFEIAEMADCELEALGLSKYLKAERVEAPQKRQKTQITQSTHPIHFWTPHIDLYVEEFL